MPLRPSETFQCQCCEEYGRLSDLEGAEIQNGEVKRLGHPFGEKQLGWCPHCGYPVTTEQVT